jgi:tRNA 5-methylaminomethyl-2-thiouridine biosynthesis bifunctional protein
VVTGASYDHDNLSLDLCPQSQAENLARLKATLALPASAFENLPLMGRAALRAVLPDRLPLLGEMPGRPHGYVAAGYASRGVVWAGLLGEALADRMLGHPQALEADLSAALSPGRFLSRQLRQE